MPATHPLRTTAIAIAATAGLAGAADFMPPGLMDDPCPPTPTAQEIAVRLGPEQRVDRLGEEMLATLEVTSTSTGVARLDWQLCWEQFPVQDRRRYQIGGLRLQLDEAEAARNGITVAAPLLGGTSPIVRLFPGETKKATVLLNDYLTVTRPFARPVTVTWILDLYRGERLSGRFSLRVAAPREDESSFQPPQDRDPPGPPLPLEPFWEPPR